MANAKIVYTPVGGTETTYTFAKNPSFDYQAGYVDGMQDRERALDGTLNMYAGPVKQTASLKIEKATLAQLQALQTAWQAQVAVDYYLDGAGAKTFTGAIVSPPQATAQPFFDGSDYLWSFDLNLEET